MKRKCNSKESRHQKEIVNWMVNEQHFIASACHVVMPWQKRHRHRQVTQTSRTQQYNVKKSSKRLRSVNSLFLQSPCYMYRVVHQVVHYILLTTNWELRCSIRRLYCDGTSVLMSAKGNVQGDPSPWFLYSVVINLGRSPGLLGQ